MVLRYDLDPDFDSVKDNDDSYTTSWDITTPSLTWSECRTFYYDGHSVIADLKNLPLVYRFELTADYKSDARITLKLYFPLSAEHYPLSQKFSSDYDKTQYIEKTSYFLYNHNIMSRCFTMLKPGVINRRLVGEVIERLEKKGFKLVGMKMMHVSEELAGKHYAEHDGKPFYKDLVDYVTSGPVIAMVWQADDCVTLMRKVVGATKPTEAVPGTIRGDYCIHTDRNIIHASDSDESAEREINLWFKPEELYDWKDCEDGWF